MSHRNLLRYGLVAAVLGLVFTSLSIADPAQPPTSDVEMGIDWLDVRGINQPVTPDQAGVEVAYKLNGQEMSTFLPVDSDTFIAKDVDRIKGGEGGVVLRDNGAFRGLLRIDLGSLPKGADIVSAALRVKLTGIQRKGEVGTLCCYRMLTPWTEDATWFRPQPGAPNWDGLQGGRDFDKKAFSQIGPVALDDPKKGGNTILLPGFEETIKTWQSGQVPNDGFLLTFNSPAVQAVIPSRESLSQSRSIVLGGPTNARILFVPNLPQVDRLLLKPDDLQSARPWVSIAIPAKGIPPEGELRLYESDAAHPVPGKLLASVPLRDVAKGPILLPELLPVFRQWMTSREGTPALLLAAETSNGTPAAEVLVDGIRTPRQPELKVQIAAQPAHLLFGKPPVSPRPGVYAQVQNGHITYGGERLRLWGVIGYPHPDRLVKMGFNAQRIWDPRDTYCYTPESAKKGIFAPYEKGDGSKIDLAEKHFAEVKANGLFVMFAALTNSIPVDLLLEDDSFVAGGDDWQEWKEAVKTKGIPLQQVIFVDERLQKIRETHAKNLLTHVNPYTGKAYGEDECIALYEVFNENGFMERILNGELSKWPPYFKAKLQRRWNDWLKSRHVDDAGLLKAWGRVSAGESLANGTVGLGPDFAARTQFPEKRAADYVEFMVDLENSFNQGFRSYCRSLFPKGVGVNVAPFSFDTMYRPNTPWAYTQSLGDVHCHGMYFWGSESTLAKPPSAYVMDSFTPEGMPTVIYETNAARPSPYRSEYPLKLAAMASKEDWDGVFWHYWGKGGGSNDVEYLAGTMGYPNPQHYWVAVYNELDPVMCSALSLAGQIFLRQQVSPAKEPEIFKIGKNALFSYDAFRGINVSAATFSKGSRIAYDPKSESTITVDGKPMPAIGRMIKALAADQDVIWDWPNERLIIDAPNAKAYVGKVNGKFVFKDGIVLKNVSTPWIAFAMSSADGKPLVGSDASRRILMNGVFDAKPTGFVFDYKTQGGPLEQGQGISNLGHQPILTDKVQYEVSFPHALEGMLKSYDFALREMKATPISGGSSIAQTGATPYMDVLEIEKWESATAAETPTQIETSDYADLVAGSSGAGAVDVPEGQGAVFPITGLHWGMDYAASRQFLQDSPLVYTSMSKDEGSGGDRSIAVTDAKLPLLWNSLADVALSYRKGKMANVEVTFKQPPSIEEILGQFAKVLGEPVKKKIDAQYGTTEIRWNSQKQLPGVYVTESQGIMKVLYEPPSE